MTTENNIVYQYAALCVERVNDSKVLAILGHNEDPMKCSANFKILQRQLLHFESRYSILDTFSRQFSTKLEFCDPQIPMLAFFEVPNLHSTGHLLPFRSSGKLTVVGHDFQGHDHTFHADLVNSIGYGKILLDISTSLHILRTKVPTRCRDYTLMPYYDSSMSKLQMSFLDDYNPWVGQITRKMVISSQLFGCAASDPAPTYTPKPPLMLKNDQLNNDQFQVLSRAITQREPLVVSSGPPGVGKSSVISEVLYSILQEDPSSKILVCCSANKATDNLALTVQKLFTRRKVNYKIIRLYAKDREQLADPELAQISLHTLQDKEDLPSNSFIDDYRRDQHNLLQNIHQLRFLDTFLSPSQQHQLFQTSSQEAKRLKALQTSAEETYLHDIVNPNILFTTLASANDNRLQGLTYDYIVVDEVGAANLLDIHLVCSKLKHHCRGVLLVGDDKQLPPTNHSLGIMGQLASQSLFDIWKNTTVVQPTQLTISYRCNEPLLEYLQLSVYHDNLHSGLTTNISKRLLSMYPFPQADCPTAFIDCKGVESSDSTGSKYNLNEVATTVTLVQQLLQLQAATASEILILSFYHGQTVALQEAFLLERGLEDAKISSVDGVQGREQNIVILSAVRAALQRTTDGKIHCPNNPTLGFIRDIRYSVIKTLTTPFYFYFRSKRNATLQEIDGRT
ncbi:MAG: AAA family ATPase [Gammaproteobacteria bacterium]|nr:AAA family ATPase [Gammaproteobacteria bacterium]